MDTRQLLIDTAERIFADHSDKALLDGAERGEFPVVLWETLRENGFHELAMHTSGVPLGEAFAVIMAAGRHALPLPLAEILLCNRWLGSSDRLGTIGRCQDGEIVDAPWARAAELVLGLTGDQGGELLLATAEVAAPARRGQNLAGESRDAIALPTAPTPIDAGEPAFALLALGRTAAMAGCLQRLLALTLQYANEREQFGRSISKFQVIQHNLAIFAGEVAAASRSADAAIDAIDSPRFELEVAAAKARVGEAAGLCAELAHQVHGAMGYTHEHQLHHFTRRVWAWRDEYGNEVYWQQQLGQHLAGLGADRLWDFLATAS